MIKKETVTIGNTIFVKTYSDEDKYVVRDGIEYAEAIDPVDLGREYVEGDFIDEEAHASDILAILTGESA